MKQYILFQMCALIVSDYNDKKFVKIGQQKPKLFQNESGLIFFEDSELIVILFYCQ